MPSKNQFPLSSPFRSEPPSKPAPAPHRLPEPQAQAELEKALKDYDYEHVLEMLDAAPKWVRNQPNMILLRATTLASLGEDKEALRMLRDIERKNPKYAPVHVALAMFYAHRGWPILSLKSARRALTDPELDDEGRSFLIDTIEEGTRLLQENAKYFNLTIEEMQRAGISHEQAQIAMGENDFSSAEHYAKEALKLVPSWIPPRNNLAFARYYSGKTADAMQLTEEVLARDPENLFALLHIVIYHVGLGQVEKAVEYAERLKHLQQKDPEEVAEYSIPALALLEDTSALSKIARTFLNKPTEQLSSRSWEILAVAAVRSEKWENALKLVQKANEEDRYPAAEKLESDLEEAIEMRHPRLPWMPPAYPGYDLLMLPKHVNEMEALLNHATFPLSKSNKQRLDKYFERYPFVLEAVKRLLWSEGSTIHAAEMIKMLEIPELDAEAVRFALSQVGTLSARQNAIMLLKQAGRYQGPEVVSVWDETEEEWRDVRLYIQTIGDIDANIKPDTMALVDTARKTKNRQEAIALLRKAVEMEPTSPIPLFNLGVLLTQEGEIDEGDSLIYKSVEIDPNYTYGHAAIALKYAEEGREQDALDHLEVVTETEVIAPQTAVTSNLAWASLAIHKGEIDQARRALEIAEGLNPEHPLVKVFHERIEKAETFYEQYKFLIDYQRESALRSHRKLLQTPVTPEQDLWACLEGYTKDMLTSSAEFWGSLKYGKKAELITNLVQNILDRQILKEVIEDELEPKELEAIQWLLENDGIQPWKEFTRKYGDDKDESVHWKYHEPETAPGVLRWMCLLFTGYYNDQVIAFIPRDLRVALGDVMKGKE